MKSIYNFLIKYKNIVMSAIIAILVLSIVLVWNIFYSDNNGDDGKVTTTVNNAAFDDSDNVLSGDSTILFVCNDEVVGKAVFMFLLDFQIVSEKIVLTPLDMNVSDGKKSYSEYYSYGGANELVPAVEKVRNCDIDRYIIVSKDGISGITDVLGPVNLYVSEQFTYESSDKSYTVDAGYNDLESAMLYTFLKINYEKKSENEFAGILCEIINSYLNGVEATEAQSLFGELCNSINTDITIADYYTCSSDIEYLLTHNTKCFAFNEGE